MKTGQKEKNQETLLVHSHGLVMASLTSSSSWWCVSNVVEAALSCQQIHVHASAVRLKADWCHICCTLKLAPPWNTSSKSGASWEPGWMNSVLWCSGVAASLSRMKPGAEPQTGSAADCCWKRQGFWSKPVLHNPSCHGDRACEVLTRVSQSSWRYHNISCWVPSIPSMALPDSSWALAMDERASPDTTTFLHATSTSSPGGLATVTTLPNHKPDTWRGPGGLAERSHDQKRPR